MRPSREQTKIDYDAIFRAAIEAGGEWFEVDPVKHMTRDEYAADLIAAGESRGLDVDMVWVVNGWMMIRKISAKWPVSGQRMENMIENNSVVGSANGN